MAHDHAPAADPAPAPNFTRSRQRLVDPQLALLITQHVVCLLIGLLIGILVNGSDSSSGDTVTRDRTTTTTATETSPPTTVTETETVAVTSPPGS